jgi:tetrahydromethanopterin S-methyltransferase subunit G
MSPPTLPVVANDVEHLTERLTKVEAKLEAVMLTQRWQMGAAVGFGVVLTILLPKISSALGLT